MSTFAELGLSDHLLSTLQKLGYETPTDIQKEAIPQLVGEPVDFIGLAQTGTGKTAAFGLPLLEKIDVDANYIQAVVLAPTRELGQQTAAEIKKFSAGHSRIKIECVYGGSPIYNQIKALRGPVQILVATPGRLIDLAKRKALRLDQISYLVLDEADEMLNMGFREELDEILKFTPKEKVTWLFSATMPSEIRRLTKMYMNEPREVAVKSTQRTNVNIDHQYVTVHMNDKTESMRRFIDNDPGLYALAFCRTKAATQKVATELASLGYRTDAIHGDLSQSQRNLVMRRFKARQLDVLVATDVAARGIDVNDLTHVFHYDIPQDAEIYTHRSGRTGRAGKKGISIAFVSRNDMYKLDRMGRQLKLDFTASKIPTAEEVIGNRVRYWAESIAKSPAAEKIPEELVAQAEDVFKELSREDLVRRMLGQEMHKMGYDTTRKGKDLNQNAGAKKGDRDGKKPTRERNERPSNSGTRFFINVGQVDGMARGDLVQFVAKHTRIDRSIITHVEVDRQHSYFSAVVDDKFSVIDAFKTLNLNGRPIRVNEEAGRSKNFHKKGTGKRPFRPAHDAHRGSRKGKGQRSGSRDDRGGGGEGGGGGGGSNFPGGKKKHFHKKKGPGGGGGGGSRPSHG